MAIVTHNLAKTIQVLDKLALIQYSILEVIEWKF